MPKFAANLTLLFNEVPFLERFAAAAAAKFRAVEFLFPYDYTPSELSEKLNRNELALILHNLPAGDWSKGERGIACHPDRREEFKTGVAKAIDFATQLNVPQLNCLVGIKPDNVSAQQARETIIENLSYAASALKQHDIKLLVEPCNYFDIPGFALNTSAEALDVIRAVNSDNLFLQYDIYHMQRMEGELAATIERNIGKIAHIQLADNPGRHEPGTGEINFDFLFNKLDALGYQGWIGCEYKPLATTSAGLDWMKTRGATHTQGN